MSEQPILGYDWEMGHEEIKLEISTYYMGEDLYIGMLAKESGVWESFSDLTVNLPFERCKANEAFIQDFGIYLNDTKICVSVWYPGICCFDPSNHDAGIRRKGNRSDAVQRMSL